MTDRPNPAALPIEQAPRDGTMLRLLVDYSGEDACHALEDAAGEAWTIGSNNFDNDGEDVWQFAGWCWSHDHFTEGKGRVVGWLPFHAAAIPAGMTSHYRALEDVIAERLRQVSEEGWTPEHDDEHRAGALATAAACYAAPETVFYGMSRAGPAYQTFISYEPAWPWADMWWKPSGDRRRDLVKAGALILAEIERIDRAASRAAP